MWEAYLNQDEYDGNYITNYFNALKYDLVDDPFIAFLYDFINTFDVNTDSNLIDKKGISNLIKSISKKSEIVDLIFTALEAYHDGKEITWDEIISRDSKDLIKFEDLIVSFNEELSKLKKDKKWVFFIDELDRARPDFALKLIEQLKHLFRMDDVYFVLAIDKSQLINIIDKTYGTREKSKDYLNRFIDFEYELLNTNDEKYIENLITQIKDNEKITDSLFDNYRDEILDCMVSFNLNRRYPIKIFNKYILAGNALKKENLKMKFFLLFLIILNVKKPILYNKIKNDRIEYDELHKELLQIENLRGYLLNGETLGPIVFGLFLNCFGTEADVQTIKKKFDEITQESSEHYRYFRIIEGYEADFYNGDVKKLLKKFTKKIELLDSLMIKT